MEWRIQLYIKLSNLNETFILFYLPEMVWIQYFNYAKKEDLLMSNSCLNTQCFFFIYKKKSIIFHTCGIFIFIFFFLVFLIKKKNLRKKRLMGDWKTWLFIANLGKWQTTFLELKPESKKKKDSNYRLSP